MAFDAKGLISIATVPNITAGSSNKIWAYFSNDALSVIDDANYFDGAYDYLTVGDMVLVSANLDGTLEHNTLVIATKASDHITTILSA